MTYQIPVLKENYLGLASLLVLCVVSYYIYAAGLTGVFIFDDIHNLSPLGQYKSLSIWDNFWLFSLEGNSGPTGRPISLASFYLNATQWPAEATGFIRTNILIHLFNGLLVYCLSFKLAGLLRLDNKQQTLFSILLTAIWLLNPIHTTSVLYIIQRMTELSASFMLIGLLFYLHGRQQLVSDTKKGLLILFFGVGISLVLSLLSKENGVLLVAYILVIEFFLLRPLHSAPPKYFNFWFLPAVVLPFIAIIVYLAINTQASSFSHRNFSLTERLLTEPRILFDYLHHILLPNVGYSTLFHDDFVISKSLTAPWSTLLAVVGLIALIGLAAYLRKKTPVITFAILWFLAGHLIESTVIALELHFEHRNYLPAYGVLLPIAWYASKFLHSYKKISLFFASIIVVLYAFVSYQNASIWGKPLELSTEWYQSHPESERSRQAYQIISKAYGIAPTLLKERKHKSKTNSLFYTTSIMLNLVDACEAQTISVEDLNETIPLLKQNNVTASTVTKLVEVFSLWQTGKCNNLSLANIEHYLLSLNALEKVKTDRNFSTVVHTILSEIYFKKKDLAKTIGHLDQAHLKTPKFKTLKLKASYLASAGLYEDALKVLDDTSSLETTFRKKLAMKIKRKDLDSLREQILLAMKKTKS